LASTVPKLELVAAVTVDPDARAADDTETPRATTVVPTTPKSSERATVTP
jgi:hypothetical protein